MLLVCTYPCGYQSDGSPVRRPHQQSAPPSLAPAKPLWARQGRLAAVRHGGRPDGQSLQSALHPGQNDRQHQLVGGRILVRESAVRRSGRSAVRESAVVGLLRGRQGDLGHGAHDAVVQPGWLYLDSGSALASGTGSYVTLKSPNGKDWSVVLETAGAASSQTFSLVETGGVFAGPIHVWATNLGATTSAGWFVRAGRHLAEQLWTRLHSAAELRVHAHYDRGARQGCHDPAAVGSVGDPLTATDFGKGLHGGRPCPTFPSTFPRWRGRSRWKPAWAGALASACSRKVTGGADRVGKRSLSEPRHGRWGSGLDQLPRCGGRARAASWVGGPHRAHRRARSEGRRGGGLSTCKMGGRRRVDAVSSGRDDGQHDAGHREAFSLPRGSVAHPAAIDFNGTTIVAVYDGATMRWDHRPRPNAKATPGSPPTRSGTTPSSTTSASLRPDRDAGEPRERRGQDHSVVSRRRSRRTDRGLSMGTMMTTAVMGATGRVGSEIVRGMLARGDAVVALVRDPGKPAAPSANPTGCTSVRRAWTTRATLPRHLTGSAHCLSRWDPSGPRASCSGSRSTPPRGSPRSSR